MTYEDKIINWLINWIGRFAEFEKSLDSTSSSLDFLFWVIVGVILGGIVLFIQSIIRKNDIFLKYWPVFVIGFLSILLIIKGKSDEIINQINQTQISQ